MWQLSFSLWAPAACGVLSPICVCVLRWGTCNLPFLIAAVLQRQRSIWREDCSLKVRQGYRIECTSLVMGGGGRGHFFVSCGLIAIYGFICCAEFAGHSCGNVWLIFHCYLFISRLIESKLLFTFTKMILFIRREVQ